MIWGQLAIKALISGLLIAAASELARRSPGWGGLLASLPLVSFLTMLWLWRDTGDAARIADLALLLRRGVSIPLGMVLFVAAGFAGYLLMLWAGKRIGLPV